MAQRKKLGPRRAAAIYDGKPHEQAGVVFGAPVTCAMAEVPTRGRYGHGVDFAYTAKTSADFSIWLEMLRVDTGDRMEDGSPDPLFYIANVAREQMRAEDFAPILRAKAKLRPGTPMEWHTSTTEKGTAGILAAFVGVPIKAVPADADKLIRSLDIATVWNRGRVITPYDAPWSEEFLRVVTNFTGAGGNETDDDVDAMVSAHGTLKGSGGKVTTGGKRLTSMGAWDAL
ncbi:MAG: hypothetical protein GY944_29550 [bacterium]|nr:hypothetical protein [bacterium]